MLKYVIWLRHRVVQIPHPRFQALFPTPPSSPGGRGREKSLETRMQIPQQFGHTLYRGIGSS